MKIKEHEDQNKMKDNQIQILKRQLEFEKSENKLVLILCDQRLMLNFRSKKILGRVCTKIFVKRCCTSRRIYHNIVMKANYPQNQKEIVISMTEVTKTLDRVVKSTDNIQIDYSLSTFFDIKLLII